MAKIKPKQIANALKLGDSLARMVRNDDVTAFARRKAKATMNPDNITRQLVELVQQKPNATLADAKTFLAQRTNDPLPASMPMNVGVLDDLLDRAKADKLLPDKDLLTLEQLKRKKPTEHKGILSIVNDSEISRPFSHTLYLPGAVRGEVRQFPSPSRFGMSENTTVVRDYEIGEKNRKGKDKVSPVKWDEFSSKTVKDDEGNAVTTIVSEKSPRPSLPRGKKNLVTVQSKGKKAKILNASTEDSMTQSAYKRNAKEYLGGLLRYTQGSSPKFQSEMLEEIKNTLKPTRLSTPQNRRDKKLQTAEKIVNRIGRRVKNPDIVSTDIDSPYYLQFPNPKFNETRKPFQELFNDAFSEAQLAELFPDTPLSTPLKSITSLKKSSSLKKSITQPSIRSPHRKHQNKYF